MPSASASHRRVDPSTSVNRNVTTPEGAAAGSADTYAGCHKEHSPTSNIGGSGPVTGYTCFRDELPRVAYVVLFRDGFQFCSDLVAPRCSVDVLKRRAVPKTFLKRGKVSIGSSQGEPPTARPERPTRTRPDWSADVP
jgi:hypothetical protein